MSQRRRDTPGTSGNTGFLEPGAQERGSWKARGWGGGRRDPARGSENEVIKASKLFLKGCGLCSQP